METPRQMVVNNHFIAGLLWNVLPPKPVKSSPVAWKVGATLEALEDQ